VVTPEVAIIKRALLKKATIMPKTAVRKYNLAEK
jgi:hypothetical protein